VFSGGGRPFQDLTVAQNVALPLCYRGGCRDEEVSDRVQRVLQVIELERFAGWLPRRLNRTSWPRVALGRALILGPELLLLDNPLAGLDPRQVRWWRDFLARLSQGGTNLTARPLTLVVAADDLRPWLAVSRQFGLVREKRWAPLGERTDVLSSTDPLLRELLAELPPGQ
jgi:ABC-type transporter Mla maintaining outer membrane lipid asymmetry ATPase subunit MlaF